MSRLYEGYEMRERHRQILIKHRSYLLHNLCVTEQLWATMISNELLSPDMVEECKTGITSNEKIGKLLDVIPTRGPDAFDRFCEALLACDHAHVAEYLKTLEATDQFAQEIKPHCVDVSDTLTEKFVKIFQKSTPSVQRFAERKFQIIMEEQDKDIAAKEEELRDLQNQNMFLQLEVTQLRSHLNTCYDTSENIAQEIQNKHVSRTFVREETEHLKNLQQQLKDIRGFEKIREFYSNIIQLLHFLATCRDNRANDDDKKGLLPTRVMSTRGKTMHDKMQMLSEQISSDAHRLGTKANVPGVMVKAELDSILRTFKDIVCDVLQIRDVFRNTMRQKRKMEGEVLSMLHNFQEIRRLEREIKEKQSHITDLGRQGTFMKKKTVNKQNRKQLDQIQQAIEQKKVQTRDIQKSLERHICSADQRLHALLNLLPDLEEAGNEFLRSDTEMTSDIDSHSGSRLGTPLGTVRPTSAIFNKDTYKKLAETLGKRDANNENETQNESTESNESHPSDSEDDTKVKKTEPIEGQRTNARQKHDSNAGPAKGPRRQLEVSRPTLTRHRSKDGSPNASPNRLKQNNKSRKVNGYSSEEIDKWVAKEQANERMRSAVKRPLVLPSAQMVNNEKGNNSKTPNMLTIAESHSEREVMSNSTSPQPAQPTPRNSQPRLSIDMKLGTKEYYQKAKQRQHSSDSEHEKGYWESKNSSASSGANRSVDSDKDSNATPAKTPYSLTSTKTKLEENSGSRERFVSVSRSSIDAEQEGPLTARKRKQSLLSPTDYNANVNFVEEETSELSHLSRPLRSSKSMQYRDNKPEKAKPTIPSSREVLKFNRIDLIGCLPGD